MKTTENISLAGYAFTIETDAYAELGTYLNDIREAFRADANAEEITADIEERIAELLREKCISGMVVDMTMVRDIKTRIGNPKELAQDDTDPVPASTSAGKDEQKKSWKTKRLYRNIDEKVFGGVCSGLGTYFGLDKALVRLAFVIIFFISFVWMVNDGDGPYFIFPIIAYICLWISMPAARTDEQKREMKGKPTSLDGYRSSDFDFRTEVREAAQSPAGQTFRRAGGVFLGILLLLFGLGVMFTCVILPSFPSIIFHEMMELTVLDEGDQFIFNMFSSFNTTWILILVNIGLVAVWVIYNAIILLFDLKAPSWRPGLVIFIAWVISLFVTAAYFFKMMAEAIPGFFI